MRISIKLLLISLIFILIITVSLIITLILFTRGNTAIQREVDVLGRSAVALSLLKLEAKVERAHAALQSVANATMTRFVPSLFPNSTEAALNVMLKVSAMIYYDWSHAAATVVYKNGDLIFTRSSETPPQIVISKSNAFWNGSAASTPSYATRWNETRFQYNFSTLQEIPTTAPAWDTVGVARGAFVHAPNWNSTAMQEPNTPQMLQATPSHLIVRLLNRTEAMYYLMSVPIYENPSGSSSLVGNFSAVKSITTMPLFLDVVADGLKEFLIGDVSRSKLFVVDTNTLNSGGIEKVISQTPGGLTFETRNYTPGMTLAQGCFPSSSKMGCFHNVSTYNDFHLLKLAIANGLPFDLPLNSSGSSRSEIRSIQFEDDRAGIEYVASVGKLSLRNYDRLLLRVYFFTPLDFFSGDLRRALNISLAISFVIAAVVSIAGGYLGLHFALRGVELLAEKMYRDPWAATKTEKQELKEMLKHSSDEYQNFWSKKFHQKTEKKDQKKKSSSKTKKEGDRKKQRDKAVDSLSSSFQEVLELEAEFVAFRSVIDLIRGFVVASGGLMPAERISFSATNSSTLPPDVQQNEHSGESNNNNSSAVDINKNNNNDNNNNNNNHDNNNSNGDTLNTTEDGTAARKKRRSVTFTAEIVGGTDDQDDEGDEENEKKPASSLLRGSALPACSPVFIVNHRYPFFIATIRFMLLDRFSSSSSTHSGDHTSEMVGQYDSWKPSSSTSRSLQSGGKLLDTDNNKTFADVTESSGSQKTNASTDSNDTLQNRHKTSNKHSPSLVDVSTLFQRLDATACASSSSLGAPSSSREHTASSIATTKLLFSRIISIACSILLQSSGFSVLQFFGDSMICYFRLRNLHSTSNLVLRFIGILHRLQRQLGEGKYRERFTMLHEISRDSSSENLNEQQQQEQAVHSQELAIRNFLSNEVLSSSMDAMASLASNSTSECSYDTRRHHRQERQENNEQSGGASDEWLKKQEADLDNFADRLVLKIVAGFSAGDLRVLDSSRIGSFSSPAGESERAKSKNMKNIRAPAVQSSSSSSDRVEFSLLGNALGESFYLADQAPSLFFAPLSSPSSSPASGATRRSRSRQKTPNSHDRERTSVDKTNNNWFNVVVQPQGPQSLAAILEHDAASTTSFCPLIVMPLLLQRSIAQTPRRLVYNKEARIRRGIPLVEVSKTKKIRVVAGAIADEEAGGGEDVTKFSNFVNALAEDMLDEDWLSSNSTAVDAERVGVVDDGGKDDEEGVQVLQRQNRQATIESQKYNEIHICKILCEL